MMLKTLDKILVLSRFRKLCIEQKLLEVNLKHLSSIHNVPSKYDLLHRPNCIYPSIIQYSSSTVSINMPNYLLHTRRSKHTCKTPKRPEYDSDSDDSDSDFKDDAASKAITVKVNSLRLDALMKTGLGIARNKVEEAFYQNKIRVNGKKASKKSEKLNIGDEVDLIKGVSVMNSTFLSISRLEILSAKERDDDVEGLAVKLRKFKTLYIENYDEHPWKMSESDTQ